MLKGLNVLSAVYSETLLATFRPVAEPVEGFSVRVQSAGHKLALFHPCALEGGTKPPNTRRACRGQLSPSDTLLL